MNQLDLQLKNQVMRRVYFVYIVKKILRPLVAKSAAFAALAIVLMIYVSVRDVIINMPHAIDVLSVYKFLVAAFAHTTTSVQLVFIAMFSISLFIISDIAKNFWPVIVPRKALN